MTPSDWIHAIEGTPAASLVAMGLALFSAFSHAAVGAMQKGRHDPWITRAFIDCWEFTLALPVALLLVPMPGPELWLVFVGVWVIHAGYKILMATCYSRGAFTLVYPIVRGTGPLVTVIFAGLVFGESFTASQWMGILLLSGGIFGLAMVNIRNSRIGRDQLVAAVLFALLGGLSVALYTVYDAYGVRLPPDAFTFLAWFFVIDGTIMPIIVLARRGRHFGNGPAFDSDAFWPLVWRGLAGALTAFASFGAVMLATRLDNVGEAAALRETSVIFAGLIGWFFLGERVGRTRATLMVLIALGALRIEFG